jgi:hypothetical protein
MKHLLDLLNRFSKSLSKDTLAKENISKTIFNHTKVNLLPENINLKDGVLEITTFATAKNEIKLKEEMIKNEVKVSRIFYK